MKPARHIATSDPTDEVVRAQDVGHHAAQGGFIRQAGDKGLRLLGQGLASGLLRAEPGRLLDV